MAQMLTAFTGTLYNDHFHIILRKSTSEQSFMDALVRPFDPFTWQERICSRCFSPCKIES